MQNLQSAPEASLQALQVHYHPVRYSGIAIKQILDHRAILPNPVAADLLTADRSPSRTTFCTSGVMITAPP